MSLTTALALPLGASLALLSCSPVASPGEAEATPPPTPPPVFEEPAEAAPTTMDTPPAVRVEPIPEISAFTPRLVHRLRAIRAASDRRQDDVFMKVGDSSTVSRGFLGCFADRDEVDLAGRDELADTIAHFRNRHAAGRNSFRRRSHAAHEGWSARHVLRGNPPPVLAEVRAIRPRFAFVMNGGNDVEGDDDYAYALRMLRIVELLAGNGVIPILSSIPPRTDDEDRNRAVDRYNRITWAIARAWQLPYLDYHQVMVRLPRQGLAGDGVHPNILVQGSRGHACRFDELGLRHGHNVRNLLALRGLDLLRRTVIEGEDPPEDDRPPLAGDGTPAHPFEIIALPFADFRDTRTAGGSSIDVYACGEQDESGREVIYRIVVDRPIRVRILAVGRQRTDVDVHLLRGEPTGEACVERADRQIESTLSEGIWYVAVDTFSTAGEAAAGEALIVVTLAD